MGEPNTRADYRYWPRFDTKIDGKLRCSLGKRRAVEITDLSSGGCSIVPGTTVVGDDRLVSVTIGTFAPLEAELRWECEERAGLEFDRPLHPAILDFLVRAHPREDKRDEPGRKAVKSEAA